jgi:formate hydrogenlyase subunit 3/multisubunit Na+/H+ antiporter MnhD subunit
MTPVLMEVLSGPLGLIVLPLAAAPLAFLLRRWATLAGLLATGIAVSLSLAVLSLPFVPLGAEPVASVLGRELMLTPSNRLALAFVYGLAALTFILAWRIPQGRAFFPMSLALLAALGGALLVRPFVFAILMLELGAGISVFLIQSDRPGSTQAALRYLALTTLALPLFLVAAWLVDVYSSNPLETSMLPTATGLIAFGFAVLFAVVPFHSWMPAVGSEAPPLGAVLILGLSPITAAVLMLTMLQTMPWLEADGAAYAWLSNAGLLLVALGAALAFSRRSFGRLMGYGALVDSGAALLALGLGSAAGLRVALIVLALRAIGLLVSASGLALLRQRVGSDAFDAVRGRGWDTPVGLAALTFGGLSLGGFPFTPGFVGRWALLNLLVVTQPVAAILLFLASMSVAAGYLRGQAALLGVAATPAEREPRLARALVALSLTGAVALALFPQMVLPAVDRLAGLFRLPGS